MTGILTHPVYMILDKVLPFSPAELQCGLKKRPKEIMRFKLANMLNDLRNGNDVDFTVLLNGKKMQKLMLFIK